MREGGDEYSTSGTTKRGAKEEGEKTCVSGETEASRVSLSLFVRHVLRVLLDY